jgi:hypothetical protein
MTPLMPPRLPVFRTVLGASETYRLAAAIFALHVTLHAAEIGVVNSIAQLSWETQERRLLNVI